MSLKCIVNAAENWGIGREDQLLVSISQDLKRFRALTTGKTVVLGRRTLAGFPGGRPLKNRENIVLTRGADIPDAVTAHGTTELFRLLRAVDQIAFNHQSFDKTSDLRGNMSAVHDILRNSDLFKILFAGIGMIGIHDYGGIHIVPFLIQIPKVFQVFIMVVRNIPAEFINRTPENRMSQRISRCLDFPSPVNELLRTLGSGN